MRKLSQALFQQDIDEQWIQQFEQMLKDMNMPQMEIDRTLEPLRNQMQYQQKPYGQQPQNTTDQQTQQPMQMNQPIKPI